MSDETQVEWKTIRIPASSYYKLVEMSGFLSIIMETRVALSFLASIIIEAIYTSSRASMVDTISNPKKLEKARKQAKGELEYLLKILKPLMEGRER